MEKKNSKKTGLVVVAAIAAIILISACLASVPTGMVGVVKTLNKPTGTVFPNGMHFKLPFVQAVENVETKTQKYEGDCSAVSKDLQEVRSLVAVVYMIDPAKAVEIVSTIGATQYESKILSPAVQECVKATTAKYTAEGLITERAKVSAEIAKGLEAKVAARGIIVQDFNIVNFEFSEAFNRAIEEKQVAQQDLIRVKTEQEQLVVKAEAQAKAAEEEARAILVRANAQAEANQKLAASITPNLVEYEKIKAWDGVLPKVSGGSAIVDFRD